mmetsp:Transcript_94735/g.265270  ORF Transcript_94735/g.265270 Transcript_94735/m.265270 type:complete len:204 (+) Transcript_94735:99-710(+)
MQRAVAVGLLALLAAPNVAEVAGPKGSGVVGAAIGVEAGQTLEATPPVSSDGEEYGDKVGSQNKVVQEVDALPATRQKTIAIGAGVVGVLSIVGPSSWVRFFLAAIGSLVGGLAVGGCYLYVRVPPASHLYMDTMFYMLSGKGCATHDPHFPAYVLWATFFLFGLIRWKLRLECGLYTEVVDIPIDSDLQQPLEPPPPPPRSA